MNGERDDSGGLDPMATMLRTAAEAAVRDVDSLSLTRPEDRSVILGLLLASRLGLTSGERGPASQESPRPLRRTAEVDPVIGGSDLLGKVASGLKVARDIVELVYDANDGQLGVVLSAKRLASDKANASRQLAQIVAGGRQAAGLEEWTPIAAIRGVVSDYGRLDSGNFAAQVQGGGLDEVFLFRGKGPGREIKVTRGGMESIADLIVRLVAPSN